MTTTYRRLWTNVRETLAKRCAGNEFDWHECFRTDMQPITILMLVSVLMIFYAGVVGS